MSEHCGQFVGELLHAVTVAHIFHLRTRSYSEHMALGDFYGKLEELADDFAEAYQGCYGLIEDWPESLTVPGPGKASDWLGDFSRFVQSTRESVSQDSELQNIIDEIQSLIDRTLYKLTFLG